MKKIISLCLSIIMLCAVSMPVSATEIGVEKEVKTYEVSLGDALAFPEDRTFTLGKDTGRLFNTTGKVYGVGQYLDLTDELPENSIIENVTIYCPTNVKVSKGMFTVLDDFTLTTAEGEGTVEFWKTNDPSYRNETSELNGTDASTLWYIQVDGTVIQNYTGMDGFTMYPGAKLIIEYTEK